MYFFFIFFKFLFLVFQPMKQILKKMSSKQFSLDKFCFRQFEENYTGSRIENISKEDFINKINELFETKKYELKGKKKKKKKIKNLSSMIIRWIRTFL